MPTAMQINQAAKSPRSRPTRFPLVEDDPAHAELVRRGMTLFSLPQYSGDGAQALWKTCGLIWTALGDTSRDANWYSKRAILSGVYSSTVLYWLGDDSFENSETWAFLDRRIENVMQFEKLKATVNNSPVLKPLMAGPNWLISKIRAPENGPLPDLPGWTKTQN